MCIICVKPADVPMPDDETIATMWDNNPDGAGVMYASAGSVIIDKGFMRLKSLRRFLDQMDRSIDVLNTTVVLHFRIGTHGPLTAANTHPFPISTCLADLQKVRVKCPVGSVHNGIIPIAPRDYLMSDTQEYITSQLALLARLVPDFYRNETARELIANQTGSKWAFLTGSGDVFTVGDFLKHKGLMFSNWSFEPWPVTMPKKRRKSAEKVSLCWLDPETDYRIDDAGMMNSADECLIDSNGRVYLYDDVDASVFPLDDVRVQSMSAAPTEWYEGNANHYRVQTF